MSRSILVALSTTALLGTGGVVVGLAATTNEGVETPNESLAPAAQTDPLEGRSVTLAGIVLRIAASKTEPGELCVIGSSPGRREFDVDGGEYGLCTNATNLAKNGLVVGRQIDGGPMTIFGFAPTDKPNVTKGSKVSVASEGGFFAMTDIAPQQIDLTFSGSSGNKVVRLGAAPSGNYPPLTP